MYLKSGTDIRGSAFSTDGNDQSQIVEERMVNIAPRSIIVLVDEKNS
jgi:hypothetical protein